MLYMYFKFSILKTKLMILLTKYLHQFLLLHMTLPENWKASQTRVWEPFSALFPTTAHIQSTTKSYRFYFLISLNPSTYSHPASLAAAFWFVLYTTARASLTENRYDDVPPSPSLLKHTHHRLKIFQWNPFELLIEKQINGLICLGGSVS